jgi:hypothetical protein
LSDVLGDWFVSGILWVLRSNGWWKESKLNGAVGMGGTNFSMLLYKGLV